MSWEMYLAIYVTGAVVCILLTSYALKQEETQHGQSIILGMGCLIVLLWPLALAWGVIVGVGYQTRSKA